MFRRFVLVAVYSLYSTASVAQGAGDHPLGSAQVHSRNDIGGRPQETVETSISVARLRVPRKAWQHYEKAVEAWDRQEPAEAQRQVDQALKIDPTFADALTLYGFIQASRRQWESAEESLQAAIRSDRTCSAAYVILAGVYNTQGRYDEAQEATRKALSAGANTWPVQYEIARVLIGKGEYENALAIIEETMRSKHGSLLRVARAHALLGLGRYPEAATELRDYLREEPSGEGSQNARDILERIQGVVSR